MTIERDGKTYELTDAEMMAAYREQQEACIIESILLHIDTDDLAFNMGLGSEDMEILEKLLENKEFLTECAEYVIYAENNDEDAYTDLLWTSVSSVASKAIQKKKEENRKKTLADVVNRLEGIKTKTNKLLYDRSGIRAIYEGECEALDVAIQLVKEKMNS